MFLFLQPKIEIITYSTAEFWARAYISENLTHHYLLYWDYLWHKSGHNRMNEWSKHKINVIFELSTLETPISTLVSLICEF